MNIVLFGPPGAGKGTQADYLVKDYNLFKISSGDLLRDEINNKTDLGNEIKSIIDDGSFVSDIVINSLIEKNLNDKKKINKLIFDGYPRNLEQAINLDKIFKKIKQKISCVLCLKVDKDVVVKRVSGRQICNKCGLIFNEFFNPSNSKKHSCSVEHLIKRTDDNEKVIIGRYETYLTKTLPVLNYYKEKKILHEINGNLEINQIYKEIRTIMSFLET